MTKELLTGLLIGCIATTGILIYRLIFVKEVIIYDEQFEIITD